jgi:hypothetical protein
MPAAINNSGFNRMDWTLISAVNNQEILKTCLLNSPDVSSAKQIILQEGFKSAGAAYNSGIDNAGTELVVLAHQDVYLPEGWIAAVRKCVESLSKTAPNWGVLGIWGVKARRLATGYLYGTAAGGLLGRPLDRAEEVRTLDEMVLILRKSSGLRFDEKLPGFHMYGPDICLESARRGMKCYVIPAFCIHNDSGYRMLPWHFWKTYWLMRWKWRQELPVPTSCTEITFWCWPMVRWNVVRALNLATGRDKPPPKRATDPTRVYRDLSESGALLLQASSD